MNTWGNGATREYVGRNALDAASMDRFDTVIDTAYQNETEILKMTGLGAREAGSLVKKANETRAKIEAKNLRIVLSTRRLIDISESIRILGLSLEEAFSRDFTERLEPMDRDALGLALVSVIAASEPSTSAIASAVVRMSDEEFSAAFPNVIARCTEQSHYTTTHEDMANWHAGLDWQGCLDIAAKRYGYGIVRAYQVGDEI
jgi:phosphotransferase system HPr-like phosphotransfer protein